MTSRLLPTLRTLVSLVRIAYARGVNPIFMAGLVLTQRRCVVLGGDAEAESKSQALVDAGAAVTVVSVDAGRVIADLAARNAITWLRELPSLEHVDGAYLVVSALRDEDFSSALYARATSRDGFLLCCIDQPAYCTFVNVATATRGFVRVGIATDGALPMLARRMREALSAAMDDAFARFVERVGDLRAATPSVQRRSVMEKALAGFRMHVTFTLPERLDAPEE